MINNCGPHKLQNTPLLIARAGGMTIVTLYTSVTEQLLKALITDHILTHFRLLLTSRTLSQLDQRGRTLEFWDKRLDHRFHLPCHAMHFLHTRIRWEAPWVDYFHS